MKLHDLIRDYARTKFDYSDRRDILSKFVDTILAHAPAQGWNPTSSNEMAQFVCVSKDVRVVLPIHGLSLTTTDTQKGSLTQIMSEALPSDITLQSECLKWVEDEASLTSFTVLAAARALGQGNLLKVGEQAQESNLNLRSAIFFSVAFRLTKETGRQVDMEIGGKAAELFKKVDKSEKRDLMFLEISLLALLAGSGKPGTSAFN